MVSANQLPEEELYDMIFDPDERNNLVSNLFKAEVLKKCAPDLTK